MISGQLNDTFHGFAALAGAFGTCIETSNRMSACLRFLVAPTLFPVLSLVMSVCLSTRGVAMPGARYGHRSMG